MTECRVFNVVTQVHSSDERAHHLLYDLLSYRPQGYFFMPRYKHGDWDGISRLYHPPVKTRIFGKFWTGNLSRATRIFSDNNLDFAIKDMRIPPEKGEPLPVFGVDDRDYQGDAVDEIIKRSRGVIRMATAGGKTALAAKLIAKLNVPSMFIVQRINLLKQATKTFQSALQVPIGVIQADTNAIERFNVATIQTLERRLCWDATHDRIKAFVHDECGLVILDEAHHGKSASHKSVLERFMNAYYRVGLSATPHKGTDDDLLVEGLFGRVVVAMDRAPLTEMGYLSKAHIFTV